jgi:hypothetical protein
VKSVADLTATGTTEILFGSRTRSVERYADRRTPLCNPGRAQCPTSGSSLYQVLRFEGLKPSGAGDRVDTSIRPVASRLVSEAIPASQVSMPWNLPQLGLRCRALSRVKGKPSSGLQLAKSALKLSKPFPARLQFAIGGRRWYLSGSAGSSLICQRATFTRESAHPRRAVIG